jgi:putative aldouronate transport system permease protein
MKQGTWRRIKRYKMMYLFLLPALITVILFSYKPMVGIIMAFQDFDINYSYLSSPFVGLKHFREFLQDPDFYRALRNTLALGSLSLLFGFPIPIIFALVLNELKSNKLKRVSQTISYLPHFISWVVTSTIILRLLDQNSGVINNIIAMFGGERIAFMRKPEYFWAIVVITNIWKETGWSSIIYLSALAGIDQEMYEAAMVDGANRWKRIIYITLPSIAPTIGLLFVLNVGSLITSGGLFDAVYNLQNALVAEKAQTLEMMAYMEGIAYMRYSYATAITLTQSVVSFSMVMIANKIYKKLTGESVF